jgi:hypothetical protein
VRWSADAGIDDAVEVSGLSALLHPDQDEDLLELRICCKTQEYRASIEHIGDTWRLLLENAERSTREASLDATRDEAIVSALLAVLDAAWLRYHGED